MDITWVERATPVPAQQVVSHTSDGDMSHGCHSAGGSVCADLSALQMPLDVGQPQRLSPATVAGWLAILNSFRLCIFLCLEIQTILRDYWWSSMLSVGTSRKVLLLTTQTDWEKSVYLI